MNRIALSAGLTATLLLATLTLVSGTISGALVSLAGLLFVAGGTLLTAILSQGHSPVVGMLRRVPGLFRPMTHDMGTDQVLFLRIAELHRRRSVRMVEMAIKGLQDDLLRQGVQLINDRCERKDLMRVLQWRIAHAKEGDKCELRVLQSMLGFAPAFGMLGTLLGLLNLLFGLGESGLSEIGMAMGFAMITTVYGLALANLVIKPLLMKMEQQSRERLAWMLVKYEALLMLHEQQHPTLIRESLEAFTPRQQAQPETAALPSLALIRS